MSEKQFTIAESFSITGIGVHTGLEVTMNFLPAPAGTGVVFKRIDLPEKPEIPAKVENVTDISRGTTISVGEAKILTIEHTLAALIGAGIDNVFIEVNATETPILDGSAKILSSQLSKAGKIEQDSERIAYTITKPFVFRDEEKDVEIIAIPSEKPRFTVMVDFSSPVIGHQHAELNQLEDFEKEVAPARTFSFLHEIEYLFKNGLIKGGDIDNAMVVVDKEIDEKEIKRLAELFGKNPIDISGTGFLSKAPLRFSNEPARHKLLDLIGDIALLGGQLNAHIIAKKPGHSSNIRFVKALKAEIQKDMSIYSVSRYDTTAKPLYDINQIKNILPHRPPFLLVDKILEMSDKHVAGLKNVTMNEAFFVGHFPDEPVMPGVLQVEAMAQVGGIFVLSFVPDPENYLTYFLKIDNARFKNKVVPGDTVIFVLELASPLRRGLCHMKGKAYVGEKLVLEAELLAQIIKNDQI